MNEIPARQLSFSQRMALMQQAQAALARDPRNIEAMLAIASLLAADNNTEQAIEQMRRALAIRKKDPEILRRLASACRDAHRNIEARKYARKACEADPRNPESHKLLGKIHNETGNQQAAVEAYRKALRLAPHDAEIHNEIGRCHANMGQHEEARKCYASALEIDPAHANALYALANSRRYDADTAPAMVEMLQKAAPQAAPGHDRSRLYYAIAKVLEDAGRFAEAFPHYVTANEEARPAEIQEFRTAFANNEDAFSARILREMREAGHESDKPVFVLGMPRSGTTLTESICAAHSAVTAADELPFLGQIAKKLGENSSVAGAYRDAVHSLGPAQLHELAESYLGLTRNVAGKTPHFTDKMPHNFLRIGLIAVLFPNARIVHCRRHPLDNCFSIYANSMNDYHNSYKNDLSWLGVHYRMYADIMAHWRKVLPGGFHEVFYEDLVANTEWNARAIIRYLDLDWEDSVMDRTRAQRSVRTLSNWQVRQPVYQQSKGRWRRFESELAPLRKAIGPYVEKYEEELESLSRTE